MPCRVTIAYEECHLLQQQTNKKQEMKRNERKGKQQTNDFLVECNIQMAGKHFLFIQFN